MKKRAESLEIPRQESELSDLGELPKFEIKKKRKVWADNRLEKLAKSTESPPKTSEKGLMNRTRRNDAVNRTQEVVQ